MKLETGLATGLFAVTTALAVLIGVALAMEEPAGGHGALHPDVAHMLRGGDGQARHGHLLWLGWGVGTLQIFYFAGAIALGARKKDGLRGVGRPLAGGTVLFVGAWTWLVFAYRAYLQDTTTPLVLALPPPTAIMLYVIWPLPVIFVALFTLGFRRYILSEDDLKKFRRLVALRSARGRDPK